MMPGGEIEVLGLDPQHGTRAWRSRIGVVLQSCAVQEELTVVELLSVLRRQEPRSISIACTHGLFADGALEKLAAAEDVTEIVCTNSVPVPVSHPKLTVLSVAPALAEAIRRTHDGESVSVLFEI